MRDFQRCVDELIWAGHELHRLGWVPATSGNFSARLDDGDLAVTVSGAHKGRLTPRDILRADADGRPRDQRRASAETPLHVQIYRRIPEARAVLHPHPPAATAWSMDAGATIELAGYELLKAFPGVDTHETRVTIPVFDNDQDTVRLAQTADAWMTRHGIPPAYLIRGHGLYTWGSGVDAALRHCEALESMFQVEIERRRLRA